MQGNTAKREEVQKIILALLVSQKSAISLANLDRDYKEQEGEQIPWKEFGYISLFDYLKSMPKYIYLERQNGMYYARGIASDKSKHVSSLVARQKESSKKLPYTRRTYRPSHYYPRTARPRVHIPAHILTDIIYMARENPNGINKEYILTKVNEQLPYVNISVLDLEEQIKDLSHELFVQGNLIFSSKSKTKFTSDKCLSPEIAGKMEENSQSQYVAATPKYYVSGDSDSELDIDDDNDFSFISPDNALHSIHENNKNTIPKKKQPISMFIQETVSKCHIQSSQLNDTFVNKVEETKHNNVENNATSHNPTEKENQGDITYFDEDNAKILISDRTKFRLEKLIQEYPNGIWCAELPKKYLQKYDIPLNYTELGFNSVREFASYLPEIFKCKQPQPSGDFILYDAKNELTDTKNKDRMKNQNIAQIYSQMYQEEDEVEALPAIVSTDISNKLMPEGVMVIGESVGQISVTDLKNRLQPYIEVFVEEVFTPSLFWVQLRKRKKLFNKLMEDLHIFYEEKSTLYKIPPVVLEKGLNCACIYNNQWHRGIIKMVKPDLRVTVMFYDYGTLKTYPPDEVYYLHRSFSYLAAQAIPCGLYNTKPCVGKQWSRGVTYEFALRTNQKPLVATIVSTDPENNSMLVTLTDTMDEEDVHINDWLVQQNLALHGTMVRIRPRNFSYSYYLECQKHYKANSEDFNGSKPSIIKTDKQFITTKNSMSNDSYTSSNHVSSTSVSNNSCNNLFSNDSEKDTPLSQKSKNDSNQNSSFKGPKELIHLFERLVSIHKSSSSSSETKPYNIQLHSDIQIMYKKKNEFKTELGENDGSTSTSSSMKSDDQPNQKQEHCSTKINCESSSKKKDINICAQQKEQKQKDIPLPKKCFINAVNLSIDSESNNLDYNTLPDDNITETNDSFKLITKRKSKINFKNVEICVPEIILSALRSSTSSVNNESYTDSLENVVPDIQKLSDITEINKKKTYKLIDKSAESCNISKEESILTKTIQHHELIVNNNIDSNSNSVSTYDNFSKNLQNTMHRTFNILQKIYNTWNDDSKLDSDDLSSSEDCDMSTCETNIKVISNTLNTNIDSTDNEISKLTCDTNINKKALIAVDYQSHSFLENEDNCLEKVELDKSLFEDVDEEVIPTFNDNDVQSDSDEWDVAGDMYDFFGHNFLSDFRNHMIQNDVEDRVQITEINDNELNNSFNTVEDINSNSEIHTDYLKSGTLETKVIKNVQSTSLNNLKYIESSEIRETKNSCFIQQIHKDKAIRMEIDKVEDSIVLADVDNACYKPQGKAKSLALMLHKLSKRNN